MNIHIAYDGQLDEAKEKALAALGALILRHQQHWLTDLPAQPVIYERKARDAAAVLAGQAPPSEWLLKESAALDVQTDTLARSIVDSAKRWDEKGAIIEATRVSTKRAIQNASSNSDVFDALRSARETLKSLE